MKHLGDITKINGAEIEPVEVITFGSPCQDLSIAGRRKGLDGERSGLFMESVRIFKEMRDAAVNDRKYPRYVIWENVPGAFSSNDGEDFRVVLEELVRVSDRKVSIPRLKDSKGRNKRWQKSGGGGWQRMEHCMENNGCSILGSTPTKKENRTYRRF